MTGNPAREWTDADDLELTITLQGMRGFSKIGLEIVRNAAVTVAFRNPIETFYVDDTDLRRTLSG